MDDTLHYTDTLNPCKQVTCGPQKKNWIEYLLLDEQGEPLADIPYRAINEATRIGMVPEFTGRSDAMGVILIEGLHPLAMTLFLAADPLAGQLQQRRLGAIRPEPDRPGFAERSPLYGPQRSGFSLVEMYVREQGHVWHYLRIGQVCDQLPDIQPPLQPHEGLPEYHFPDPQFRGFTLGDDQLNRRHVLELCPFRAWSLLLHHQQQYSLANAYNLGLMSILAYSTVADREHGSVSEFFDLQCKDLSRTPRVVDGGQNWPTLVIDVPFNDRYTFSKPLDTTKAQPPEGNTQLFYAISSTQVLVAWRGTETHFPFTDLATDGTFRPVETVVQAQCEPNVPCTGLLPEGKVHLGFRDAFDMASRIYDRDLGKILPEAISGRSLFVCGHSLGGALALIHAAALKERNPLLYTYGMPRTFTLKAIQHLKDLWHFRHVNDTDIIPRVPFEADLDSKLYDVFGRLGTLLGFYQSVRQAVVSNFVEFGDPYSHHGELAMFLRVQQHLVKVVEDYPVYNRPDDPPHFYMVSRPLRHVAKLYLVPSLSETLAQQAEESNKRFAGALSQESRERYFPRHGNPVVDGSIGIGDHFMSKYQPYMHNQLLELINPRRKPKMQRQDDREKLVEQMREFYEHMPRHQYTRDQNFLELQGLMEQALLMTSQLDGGPEALQRFDAITTPNTYTEKVYG